MRPQPTHAWVAGKKSLGSGGEPAPEPCKKIGGSGAGAGAGAWLELFILSVHLICFLGCLNAQGTCAEGSEKLFPNILPTFVHNLLQILHTSQP